VATPPLTPNSAPAPYLTPAEFLLIVDPDLLAQAFTLVPGQPLTDLIDDQRVAEALGIASGLLESHAVQGTRYAPQDLMNLTGNSRKFLNWIVASVAVYCAYSFRDGMAPPENVVARYEQAQVHLERLRTGQVVFAFAEVEDAGLPYDRFLTVSDLFNQNLLTARWQRTFGVRQTLRRGLF
jgi:hypothetical protein